MWVHVCVCVRENQDKRGRERNVVRDNLSVLNLLSVLLCLSEEEFY